MHVVIFGSQQSIHVVRWANALAERGYRIDVLSMHAPSEPFHESVNVITLPFDNPAGYILNIPFIRKKVVKLKPDLIHSFYAFGHGFLARMSGYKPHLLSVLGSDVYDDPFKNRIYRHITTRNISVADLVCSTSHVMKEQILNLVKKDIPITITPFGVDTGYFKPKEPEPLERKYDFIIGTVKSMKVKYGVDILIRAFAAFCVHYPDKKFKLILVGEGEQLEALKNLANSLDILQNCEFPGRVPHAEVPEWLNKFDVFAALSRYNSESFGVAVLEAMTCEKAVIVSDAGGLPEVVQQNITGLVVPKEDVDAAEQAIIKLYENPHLREKLGKAGRQHVVKNYNWDESVQKMEQVYKKVIREYRKSS